MADKLGQDPSKPATVKPEDMDGVTCYNSESDAESAAKSACGNESECDYTLFFKQGHWKDGKAPKPDGNGKIPNDSLSGGDDTNTYDYGVANCDYSDSTDGGYTRIGPYWDYVSYPGTRVRVPQYKDFTKDFSDFRNKEYQGVMWCYSCKSDE